MAQEPIQVIALEPVIDSAREVLKVLARAQQSEILEIASGEEAFQVALQFQPCLIVASLRGSLDGEAQLKLFTRLKKNIQMGQVKVLLLSSVKNHPLAGQVAALGITDYAEEPVPVRSLLFKVNLMFKAIRNLRGRAAKEEEKIVFKAEGAPAAAPDPRKGEVKPTYKPALRLGEDTFVFRNVFPKKLGGKFLLQPEGPAPETGEWKLEGRGKKGEESKWRWKPKDAAPDADPTDGWVHEGDEPSYNSQTGRWQLRSEKPHLYFRKKGQNVGAKAELMEGQVVLAEDSRTALDALALQRTELAQQREALRKGSPEKSSEETPKKESTSAAAPAGGPAPIRDATGAPEAESVDPQAKKHLLAARADAPPGAVVHEGKEEKSAEPAARAPGDEPTEEDASRRRPKLAPQPGESERNDRRGDPDEGKGSELQRHGSAEEEKAPVESENFLEAADADELAKRNKQKGARPQIAPRSVKEGERAEGEEEAGNPRRAAIEAENEAHPDRLAAQKELLERETRDPPAPREKAAERAERAAQAQTERARARAEARLRQLKAEAKGEAESPLPASLTKEEERHLRHNLGLGEAPIGSAALAKRARMERLQSLQKAIQDISSALKGEGAPLEALFPDEESEGMQDERGESEASDRNFRAIDSIDPEAQEDFFGLGQKSAKGVAEETPRAYYLPREKVRPLDGSWEEAGGQWVYVANGIYVDGFGELRELLPTWVFRGEEPPVLEVAEDRWKFLGAEPDWIESEEELPAAIADVLCDIAEQAGLARGEAPREKRKQSGPISATELADEGASARAEADALAEVSGQTPMAHAAESAPDSTLPAAAAGLPRLDLAELYIFVAIANALHEAGEERWKSVERALAAAYPGHVFRVERGALAVESPAAATLGPRGEDVVRLVQERLAALAGRAPTLAA